MATARGGFAIFDAWRGKVTFPYLVEKVYERWEQSAKSYGRYPDRLVVENKSSGTQIAQQIDANNLTGIWTFPDGQTRRVPPIPLLRIPAQQSKTLRAQGISGYHEAKLIALPRGGEWVKDFVDEHALFDKGPHDDWVDCTVHGITYFTRPVEEHEETIVHDEDVRISSDLDELELRY
jgi:predicted phage terminase large subunit-like protein